VIQIRAGATGVFAAMALLAGADARADLDLSGSSREQIELVDGIRAALKPLIEPREKDGSALLLGFDELYEPLSEPERGFIEALRTLEPPTPSSIPVGSVSWVRLTDQVIRTERGPLTIPLQLLPQSVWEALEAMNRAMQADLGRRLVVGSGYRSAAYQAWVFLNVMPAFGYSIRETKRHVSLPGRSEHSLPERQGLDFINQDGVDHTYSNPEAFARLPEYRWLEAHAARFGFVLSSPRGSDTAFAPWHWRYQLKAP
jgi:D-alanyl-D-alanine carboxypeptidase